MFSIEKLRYWSLAQGPYPYPKTVIYQVMKSTRAHCGIQRDGIIRTSLKERE